MEKFEKFKKYPKTVSFSNFAHDIRAAILSGFMRPDEKMTFEMTTKAHGTNAAVAIGPDNILRFQSRNRLITPENDNAGFAQWSSFPARKSFFIDAINQIKQKYDADHVVVFGEFCGGNIKSGVALRQLDKMFIAFDVMVDDEFVIDDLHLFNKPDLQIYNSHQFGSKVINIDLNNLTKHYNDLVEHVTGTVEPVCPIGKYFGVEGIGEGVVLRQLDSTSPFRIKVKGDKHAAKQKKSSCDKQKEMLDSDAQTFAMTETEKRMEQCFEYFSEMGIPVIVQNISKAIDWVTNDIMEEEMHVITENQWPIRPIKSVIARTTALNFKRAAVQHV